MDGLMLLGLFHEKVFMGELIVVLFWMFCEMVAMGVWDNLILSAYVAVFIVMVRVNVCRLGILGT